MTKRNSNLLFALAAGLIATGAVFGGQQVKTYPVNHTTSEWDAKIGGLRNCQRVVHESNLPANIAFYCDSVLQSHMQDIFGQVQPAVLADQRAQADSSKKKGGKP